MNRYLTSILMQILAVAAFAQSGTIVGIVTDNKTKEPIIGASIVLEDGKTGTVTDFDGAYTLANVPAGEHTLQVSYLSFVTQKIPVKVDTDQTATINGFLEQENTTLEGIVVKEERKTNTTNSVILETKRAEQIAVGVSEAQIKMSQDRDAGQVIKRLAGISIQDDRFVNIRGMAERYNVVLLNGAVTPSSEVDIRAFSFDLLPSSAIDRMQVYKTASSDMPSDFAGGVIKVYTKSQNDNETFTAGFSSSMRPLITGQQTTTYQGSATDVLGFDNGLRALTNAPTKTELDGNKETAQAFFRSLPDFYNTKTTTITPDLRASVGYSKNFKIGNLKVSTINALNYSNTTQQPFNALQERYEGIYNNELVRSWKDVSLDRTARVGLLSNWSVRKGNTKIDFRNMLNQSGTSITQTQTGTDISAAPIEFYNQSFRYIAKTIYSGQLGGQHELNPRTTLNWTGGFGYTNRNEPDYRIISSTRDIGSEAPFMLNIPFNVPSLSQSSRFYANLREVSGLVKADIERKIGKEVEGKEVAKVRAGVWAESKDRFFEARWFGYTNPNFVNMTGATWNDLLSSDKIGTGTSDFVMREGTNNDDTYAAQSLLGATYVNAFLPIGNKITTSFGVRAEYNRMQLQSYTRGSKTLVEVDNPMLNILPSANVSYNINEKNKIRAAYGMTINRPEFRELAPFSYYDFEERVAITGNTTLQSATIHNADLRYEFYPSPNELITVAAFYKHFVNPIEREGRASGNGINYTFGNPLSADSYGLELDIRKVIPGILNNKLATVFNASYIQSNVDASNRPGQIQKRALQGQSPYLLNAGLYYNADKFKASVLYNIVGNRIFVTGDLNGNQTIYEMARNVIDCNFSYNITNKVELTLGAQDILNQPFKLMIDTDSNQKIDANDRLFRQYQRGTYVTFGAKFRL